MEMTIEEHIAQLVRVKHYAAPRHYETLDVAIDTMRKYQKIQEIVKAWEFDHESMVDSMEKINNVIKED